MFFEYARVSKQKSLFLARLHFQLGITRSAGKGRPGFMHGRSSATRQNWGTKR
jgi:hypothetical protein